MQTNFFLLMLLWCYIGATFWQLFFCWGVFARFAFYTGKKNRLQEREKNTLPPRFSVIICARNEAANLRRWLPAVLAQEYPSEWELLVVDDASTDETSAVLKAFQEKNPYLCVLRLDKKPFPGKKYALEQGIISSRYEYILLTDADCAPASANWLTHMAAAMTATPQTELVLGYGPMKKTKAAPSTWARFETLHTALLYFSFARSGMPYMGVGRNLAFKKALFIKTGGFSAHMHLASGDDDLLVNAAATPRNLAICIDPQAFVFSESKTNWRDWFLQKRRHLGASGAYRVRHQLLLASISLSHVFHYFLLLVLLLLTYQIPCLLALYALRLGSLWIIYRRTFDKLDSDDLNSRFILFDIGLALYYGLVVPYFLLFGKKNAWK